jgi:hypothetical protein
VLYCALRAVHVWYIARMSGKFNKEITLIQWANGPIIQGKKGIHYLAARYPRERAWKKSQNKVFPRVSPPPPAETSPRDCGIPSLLHPFRSPQPLAKVEYCQTVRPQKKERNSLQIGKRKHTRTSTNTRATHTHGHRKRCVMDKQKKKKIITCFCENEGTRYARHRVFT